MNKLECISTFIAVVEANSFANAAKKLRLSTAAVSRQVSALEHTLGAQLLMRTTRRLSLTDVGVEYYEQTKRALEQLQLAQETVSGSQKEATGLLHVLSNRYFAHEFILPCLQAFMQQNPKLRIKLEVAERFPDLMQEDIDILVGISMEGPPTLKRRKIATTRYVLCASPSYLKKHGTPKTPADLANHRYITHHMRVPDNAIKLDDQQEIFLDPILWLNDSRAMCDCAIQGLGIVRLHDYIVNDALKSKKLIEILPTYHQVQIPVFLYYQQSRYLQPKIRKFIDFLTS
ncbi:MAG: LysR family transcriptional regulator [Candidatus Berkiella sp.]